MAVEAALLDFDGMLIDEVEPFHGSRALTSDLKERGVTVVLASSSPKDELDH